MNPNALRPKGIAASKGITISCVAASAVAFLRLTCHFPSPELVKKGHHNQVHNTLIVKNIVTSQYSHTHFEATFPLLEGLKSQKLALKKVATKVPGKKINVTMAMTRISAPCRWLSSLSFCASKA